MLHLPLLLLPVLLPTTGAASPSARIPMWTDIYLRSDTDFADIDQKLAFLMETYDIVSLEKCLHRPGGSSADTVSQSSCSPVTGMGVTFISLAWYKHALRVMQGKPSYHLQSEACRTSSSCCYPCPPWRPTSSRAAIQLVLLCRPLQRASAASPCGVT